MGESKVVGTTGIICMHFSTNISKPNVIYVVRISKCSSRNNRTELDNFITAGWRKIKL